MPKVSALGILDFLTSLIRKNHLITTITCGSSFIIILYDSGNSIFHLRIMEL